MRTVAIGLVVSLGLVACEAPEPPVAPEPRTVFLNRGGGTYTHGDDDSSANVTVIVGERVEIDPPAIEEDEWEAFVGCLGVKFEPFDVTITLQDPGPVEHTELALIDDGTDIGVALGVTGVSPFGCEADGPKLFRRGVTFVSWNQIGDTALRCWVAAQTLGNSFGLDVSRACPDIMSSRTDCGPIAGKEFVDVAAPCGSSADRPCRCGGSTQSSYDYLLARFGAAP